MSSVAANSKKNNKVILLGDSGVGKTALIQRFTHNKFEDKENATIGIDFVGKNVSVQGHTYRLQLWDTAGQERYRSLIPSYLKDAVSAIFVYDVTNRASMESLESWIQLYRQSKTDKSFLVLCGNKTDLLQKKNFEQEDVIRQIKQKYAMKSFLTSAADGSGVTEMFDSIIEAVHKQQQKKKRKFDDTLDMMPYSSQNLHSEDMISNRSNRSSRSNRNQKTENMDNKPRTEDTIVKIKTEKQNIDKTKLELSQKIQGGKRCC